MVTTVDEEVESGGMISAIEQFVRLRDRHNLQYVGVINSDYTAPREPGDNNRYIYQGAIGKYLACFYIRGSETHEGEAFRGMDANLIASELVNEAVLDTRLCDEADGEITVPPVTMKLRDFKVRYDAQTPIGAVIQLNILSHGATAQDFLVKSVGMASRALSRANQKRVTEWTAYAALQSRAIALEDLGGKVWTYEQLFKATQQKLGRVGQNLRQQIEESAFSYISKARELLGRLSERERNFLIDNGLLVDIDSRERSLVFVRKLVEIASQVGVVDRSRPMIVVFFAPSFFPPVRNALSSPLNQVIAETVGSGAYGDICIRNFYPYVSDISFLRMDDSFYNSLPQVRENFPIWRDPDESFDKRFQDDFFIIPSDLIRDLNCDVTNIGPWGKEAHGAGERVYMPYSFETVPQLIYDVILRLLDPPIN
jgi:arginine utilization protein RocB